MAQAELSEQDASVVRDIKDTLNRRRDQYTGAFVQGLYVREEGDTWLNGATKITALDKSRSEADNSLDYGDLVYLESTVSLDELDDLIEHLAAAAPVQLVGRSVRMVDDGGAGARNLFRPKEFVNDSHYWMKSEWPANLYVYEGLRRRRGFPHGRLVSADKPLYPDAYHLVAHRMGADLRVNNALLGSVLLLLPNYQARISEVRIGTKRISVAIDIGVGQLSSMVGKVFATSGAQVFHTDVRFRDHREVVELLLAPDELEVSLLNKDDGEVLDSLHLRGHEMGAYAIVDESDPRFVQLLIEQKEGLQVEFKPGKLRDDDREELAETAVAFANKVGGRILVGVRDDGTVDGCYEDGVEDRVTKVLVDRCSPPIDASVQKFTVEDKPVYVVHVAESSEKPHELKSRGFYIRHGSNDYPMSRAEMLEIMEARSRSNAVGSI